MGQRNQFQLQGAIQEPSATQTCQGGQSMGRGQVQSSQARTSGTQGRVYAVVPKDERTNQPNMQGTFLYLHLLFNAPCSLLHLV